MVKLLLFYSQLLCVWTSSGHSHSTTKEQPKTIRELCHIFKHRALTGLLDWGGTGQLQCSQTSSKFSIQSLSESVLQEHPIFSAIWENVALRNAHVLLLCTVSKILTPDWLWNGEDNSRWKETLSLFAESCVLNRDLRVILNMVSLLKHQGFSACT